MTITAEELQEFRDQQSGIIGMMMATTNARSGKMTLIESQMLRLLEFVNRVPEALSEIEELSARAERAEAELAALAAQKPIYQVDWGDGWQDVDFIDFQRYTNARGISSREVFARAAPAGVVVPWPNEGAASAMFDIFYQASNVESYRAWNVQLSRSDAAELGKWLTEVLGLRDEANKKAGE